MLVFTLIMFACSVRGTKGTLPLIAINLRVVVYYLVKKAYPHSVLWYQAGSAPC